MLTPGPLSRTADWCLLFLGNLHESQMPWCGVGGAGVGDLLGFRPLPIGTAPPPHGGETAGVIQSPHHKRLGEPLLSSHLVSRTTVSLSAPSTAPVLAPGMG